jgi:putative phage-type endonuclease
MEIIQDATQLEQGTDAWKMARLGYVSASNLDAVMAKGKSGEATTRRNYKIRLVTERLTQQIGESYSNAAMEWGVQQEQFARMAYEVKTENFVDKTGFWKHPSIPWVGCSPDGLVSYDGLVEIKSPNSATHVDYLLAKQVPSEYVKQVQGQLWVMERDWVDFISFDPRLPERNQLLVVRAFRDEKLIKLMEDEVQEFLGEVEEIIEKLSKE